MALSGRQVALAVQGLDAARIEFSKGLPPSRWAKIVSVLPSDNEVEVYEDFGAAPMMAEWKDEIRFGGEFAYQYVIHNVEWAAGIKVKKTLVADNKLAQITPKVQDLAKKAAYWPFNNIRLLLLAGEGTTLGTCYDGQPFFSAAHVEGDSGAQSNLVDGSGTDYADISDDMATVITSMAGLKDDQGDYTYQGTPDTVFVPQVGPIYKTFMAMYQGKQPLGEASFEGLFKNEPVVVPGYTGNNWWAADTSDGGWQAFIEQLRAEATPDYEAPKMAKDIFYFLTARAGFAYGQWKRMFLVKND